MPSRAVSIAISLLVGLLMHPAGARAQVTTANVTLGINTAQAQTTAIASDFSGFSFEMGSVIYDRVNDGWYLSGSNGAMIALAKTLGIKSVRVGGNSAESGNIATAADEDAVMDYCHAIGANLIWDLEIDGTLYDPSTSPSDPTAKPVIAQGMQNYLNSKGYQTDTNSLVFQVGNEPDLMPNMTLSIYDTDFGNYLTAINSLYSGARMAGPDTAGGGTYWSATFCPAEGPSGQIAYVCQHLYYFGTSQTSATIAQQIASMLSASDEAGYASFLKQWVPAATAAGLVTRYEETNSFFHNGSFGASNAYASALWGLGYMYYHAQAGLGGLNFHMGENSNNPAYNALSPANVATSYTVNPLAYAIAAFNIGGHGNIVPVTIGNSSGVNMVAYSVLQADGSLIITAINREYGSPAHNDALSISTSGTTYNDAQVMFLTGSNNNPSTLTGVTLGGSAISGQGSWTGSYMGMAAPSSGSFALTLPIAQAAIIRLYSANGPAAPINFTATPGSSQATLNWTASASATSYVIERANSSGGPYTTIATGVTNNFYTDTGLSNGSTYYYVVAASDANGIGPQSAEASATLPLVPTITSGTSATAAEGAAFSYQIVASYNPTNYTAAPLPDGVAVNGSTGLISGTATESGTFAATLTASNLQGTGTSTLTITVTPEAVPVISNTLSATGTMGYEFSYEIMANNNPISYSAAPLPDGVSIDESTGLISGTPTDTGTFATMISAINYGGTDTETVAISILPPPPAITNSVLTASGTNGSAFSYQIQANSNPTSFGATGLPLGLSVDSSTGLISGTLHAGGTFDVTLSAGNATGTGTASLMLTVTSSLGGLKGVYEGLAAVDGTSEGLFTVTISSTSTGAFTGKLSVAGASYGLKGKLDPTYGTFDSVEAQGRNTLNAVLSVDNAVPGVNGSITITTNFGSITTYNVQSTMLGAFTASTLPSGLQGYYTVILPSVSDTDPAVPAGNGYGTMTVSKTGALNINAKLGDGTGIVAKAPLHTDGKSWTLFIAGKTFSLAGTLTAEDLAGSDCDGTLDWIRFPLVKSVYYSGGFTIPINILAAKYVAPPLETSTGALILSGGNLPDPAITDDLTITAKDAVTVTGTTGTAVRITAKLGGFSGKFPYPPNNKARAFGGIIYIKPSPAGYGLFLGTDQSGSVEITP